MRGTDKVQERDSRDGRARGTGRGERREERGRSEKADAEKR